MMARPQAGKRAGHELGVAASTDGWIWNSYGSPNEKCTQTNQTSFQAVYHPSKITQARSVA